MSRFDSSTDVVIVGAGPYGLSLAAHLSHRRVEHRIFGDPMRVWRDMYPGMGLKSPDFGTNVYTPSPGHTFVEYCRDRGKSLAEPVAISDFAEYGLWVQERQVPELERCQVRRVALADRGFAVELDTGERLRAGRVVMATGLAHWRRLPGVLANLPAALVSHTSERSDLSPFRGRDVTVIGAGQSALEAATLLHEIGATTRLLVRGGGAYFADPPAGPRSLRDRVAYPASVLGPGRLNLALQKLPLGPHFLMSNQRRVRFVRSHLGPWGAWWLRERFEGKVTVYARSEVVAATPIGSRLALRIRRRGRSDLELQTDHVICGTGYEVDLDRHPVLDPALSVLIDRIERAPRLNWHFETSVSDLYFVGAAAAFSFGPLLRFVAGAAYTAPALARRLARTARSVEAEGRARPVPAPVTVE